MADQPTVRETNNPHGEVYESMPQHAHWDGYDMSLEGCRFNILDGLVSASTFDAAAAAGILAELESLAQSKGYGEEDSYLCDTGSYTPDEIDSDPLMSAQREMHQDDPDSQFTAEIATSLSILRKAAATDEASSFVGTIEDVLVAARQRGAQMRRDVDERPAGPRGP